jgi:N-methylhydantoinase A/oxoprolinase/acetone carboxylase beta subunit
MGRDMKLIGVDVGGTFTDVFLIDETGMVVVHKVPSTPDDPSNATVQGIKDACEKAGIGLPDLDIVFHATTVATNAVLQRVGAKVGLITTEGFRDVLHIARHKRPLNFSLYQELPWQRWPLVPRRLRFPVEERVQAPDGTVLKPLNEEQVVEAIDQLRAAGVEAVAVCFLHSYLNPDHERRVGELLAKHFPAAFVSLRHLVSPEYREYESFNTVAANAFIGPATGRYIERLGDSLSNEGVRGDVLFMTSSGGVEPVSVVGKKPVNMLLSGPVAGVMGGLAAGKPAGFDSVITFDVGGTSADIGVIHHGQVRHKHWLDNQIGGLHLRLSVVDVSTIGAGGGSVAYVDRGGMLQVGPKSAGAFPGPSCYGLGGEEATVTDAQLLLGRLSETSFLGGRMPIRRDLAEKSIATKVAEPLGLGVMEAAAGIVRIATSHMTSAIELNSVRRGYDPRDFALVAFGGAGPLFAPDVAYDLQIPTIIAPRYPGIASAMGLLATDVVHYYSVSVVSLLSSIDTQRLGALIAEMESQASKQLAADGFSGDQQVIPRYAECRYAGQGYEIRIEVPNGEVTSGWLSEVASLFHKAHEREYSHAFPESEVELVNIGVAGVAAIQSLTMPTLEAAPPGSAPQPVGTRQVWFERLGQTAETNVFRREDLLANHVLKGAALVEQEDSTVHIPPRWQGKVDSIGNVVITANRAGD